MKRISYARHRFPPDVIRHAISLYLRFTLSYRDVEDLLAERGLIVSNEAAGMSGIEELRLERLVAWYGASCGHTAIRAI
jgi:transposase-like protein